MTKKELERDRDDWKAIAETNAEIIARLREELTAENVRLREALRSIAQEEDMMGFMYAARIAKTALEEKE